MSKGFLQPVLIEWVDSVKDGGWREKHPEVDLRCASVGMLVLKNKDFVQVCLNRSAYGAGDYMSIPRRAVKKIHKLKIAD